MRKILLMVAVASLAALVMFAQDKGGGGKGGGKGKAPRVNLKVLPDDANLIPTMQSFVAGLGVMDKGGCNFCHEMDRSSDAKQEKVMARMMISMVKDINSKFPDGKEHVTCFTCHRGSTAPATAP
ncbi:MAG: photosynthetic reaction center cytochrome c subunit [Acidobacteriia bacterium]|nr:photosynthetic reaction center cytochrome c subunit [Terriglobia bacterium]